MKKNLIFNRVKIELESNSKDLWLVMIFFFWRVVAVVGSGDEKLNETDPDTSCFASRIPARNG